MPTRRLTTRPSGAPRRVQRTERPEHAPCVLPIHETCSSELRAFHAKHPPANLQRLLKDAVETLRDASGNFAEKRRTLVFETERERDEETEQAIAELGKQVEKNIRGLIDLDQELQNMKHTLADIGESERQRGDGDGVQPVGEYEQQMKRARKSFMRKDLKDRYGNIAEYIDFRSVVHALSDPTAPQPQRKDWFKKPMFTCDAVAEITDEEPVSSDDEEREDNDIEMVDGGEESDDDIQETSITRNLKCPITMRRFEEPVKAACGHVFEKSAIVSMFKDYRKLKKPTVCPTAGCGREIKAGDLKDDPVTKSLVEAEIRRERQEEERAMMSSDDEEEEEEGEPATSRSKSKGKSIASRSSVKKEEEEIPYGDEEGEGDDHGEGPEDAAEEDDNEEDDEDDEEMEDSE
ncbi:hypothetical protein H072_5171 [Dactylellina haptotyla CBS 200.50]|uniref:SP-RING-type domain-containing protein n=1 Tax=Dactylellina haptotyla (strain CBS 200.50) TaxID=1284197 RepID=S8ADC7_DACHA|nr:hypothetical protein H072_5171 [Dactylellina haptotyla CBS 200.50]